MKVMYNINIQRCQVNMNSVNNKNWRKTYLVAFLLYNANNIIQTAANRIAAVSVNPARTGDVET